eukprot:scaffold15975_cov27-Tisochrysis_lutea.AAC.5
MDPSRAAARAQRPPCARQTWRHCEPSVQPPRPSASRAGGAALARASRLHQSFCSADASCAGLRLRWSAHPRPRHRARRRAPPHRRRRREGR